MFKREATLVLGRVPLLNCIVDHVRNRFWIAFDVQHVMQWNEKRGPLTARQGVGRGCAEPADPHGGCRAPHAGWRGDSADRENCWILFWQ